MQFFEFSHLPADLQAVSRDFRDQALRILTLPRNPERTVSLRKLLESKDAAVRAARYVEAGAVRGTAPEAGSGALAPAPVVAWLLERKGMQSAARCYGQFPGQESGTFALVPATSAHVVKFPDQASAEGLARNALGDGWEAIEHRWG